MSTTTPAGRPRIVIVGCGFGGLEAARKLQGAEVDVTIVEKTNHHLFQPLLYQVATAGLAAPSIAAPVRLLFRSQPNITTLLGEVTQIDPAAHEVQLANGTRLGWDHLIVAAGATHSYFGNDGWARMAPGLKTLADAFEIRRRVLMSFEAAEIESDPARRRALLTFAVIGAGPTGVEMAGTLAEIARHTLEGEFRRIDPSSAEVLLIEGGAARAAGDAGKPEPARAGAVAEARRAGAPERQGHGDRRDRAHRRFALQRRRRRHRQPPHRLPLRDLGRRRGRLAAGPPARRRDAAPRPTAPAASRCCPTSACRAIRTSAWWATSRPP